MEINNPIKIDNTMYGGGFGAGVTGSGACAGLSSTGVGTRFE
jgi:hypothetical protein